MDVSVRIGISTWLLVVSLVDLRTRRIPNALVLPVLAVALVSRLVQGNWLVAAVCVGLYLLWLTGLLGGAGDAKLLMALVALFPATEFVLILGAVVLVVTLPWTAVRYRRRWGEFFRSLRPTEERLEREGVPFAWVYSIGTLIYMWTSLS
ncbi:MAG: prepilin peptidase [Chloroflexi bacterium]|nr:prepilin peptidase [Chloroflexota bacterium]